ncbi:MAG: metal ABC transporter ATP-binding protein [Gammaproteobacteria bacterium]
MRNHQRTCAAALSALLLAGCASNPDKISTIYVSPLKYKDYNCDQVGQEIEHVGHRTSLLYNQLKKERTADNWQMGVGLLLFWPALFALEGGDGPQATEYAQLKGEYEALREASVSKSCNIQARSPEEIIKEAEEARKKEAEAAKAAKAAH